MATTDIVYAVHVDGALLTSRNFARAGEFEDLARDLLARTGQAEAAYRMPDTALRIATALKQADPTELVTVVLWEQR